MDNNIINININRRIPEGRLCLQPSRHPEALNPRKPFYTAFDTIRNSGESFMEAEMKDERAKVTYRAVLEAWRVTVDFTDYVFRLPRTIRLYTTEIDIRG